MSRPGGVELQRVNSYQWPSGHVGHLTQGQQSQLQKFKDICKSHGYFEPGNDTTPASHDDETLLRYLRARKFVPQDAFAQFKATEDWRRENQLDTLYETIDVAEYDATRKLYPQWTGRRDNRGIPLYVFEVASISAKDVNAYENDEDRKKEKLQKKGEKAVKIPRKMLRLFALYENLCRFVLPLCSALPTRSHSETPISQSNNIVDINKVGVKKFWDLRAHLQDSSALATAHYPETLDHIFIIGAPSWFPTVWDWAKGWFDPITVAKVSIIGNKNVLAELQKYIDIDNIPKKYGGNLDWSFGELPYLEPEIANSLQWREEVTAKGHRTLPAGPVRWQYDEKGDLVAVAIGTENGVSRKRVLAGLHPEAGIARLALSPGRQPLNRHPSALFAAVSHSAATTVGNAQEKVLLGNETAPKAAAANVVSENHVNPPTALASTLPANVTPGHDADQSVAAPSDRTNGAGIYTVPYRDPKKGIAHPPEDSRQGTSHTRQAQQAGTHAEGQLQNGTPHMRVDGQGTEHAVMEPRTVGQAVKETPMTARKEDEPPSVVEQAHQLAEQAQAAVVSGASAVLDAVALGGGEGKEGGGGEHRGEGTQKRDDPRLDHLDQTQVEEFLRQQSKSRPDQKGS